MNNYEISNFISISVQWSTSIRVSRKVVCAIKILKCIPPFNLHSSAYFRITSIIFRTYFLYSSYKKGSWKVCMNIKNIFKTAIWIYVQFKHISKSLHKYIVITMFDINSGICPLNPYTIHNRIYLSRPDLKIWTISELG